METMHAPVCYWTDRELLPCLSIDKALLDKFHTSAGPFLDTGFDDGLLHIPDMVHDRCDQSTGDAYSWSYDYIFGISRNPDSLVTCISKSPCLSDHKISSLVYSGVCVCLVTWSHLWYIQRSMFVWSPDPTYDMCE
jgi:hypothetical protein